MLMTPWRRRTLPLVAGAALVALLAATPVAAQDTGTVSGTIVDATGEVVPGATITLTHEATVSARTMQSDERGEFAFRAVTPGSYTVKVELTGFRSIEHRNNVLNASGRLDLGKLTLEVGALSEIVSVTATGTYVETKNSDYSGLLTATQISQIQTKGRDVVNLLRLLPGVHYENDIDAMGDSFGSQLPNIAGQRRAWNQVTVDGLNGNELSGTGRMNSSINLDAIAEVKVLLNTYKAEFGHSAGANIEIVSKSGSSVYHGSGYWYGRRDAWNASPWENNRTGLPRPKLKIDTPGFNLGGPVRIPGLFDQ
jgi:carboxypeptidase family protein/TonB-dependent receptor-like protein